MSDAPTHGRALGAEEMLLGRRDAAPRDGTLGGTRGGTLAGTLAGTKGEQEEEHCQGAEEVTGPLDERLAVVALPRGEIKDRLLVMLETEGRYRVTGDYIAEVQNDGMRPIWRARVFEWLFEFVDEYQVSVSTVAVALNYVDRYLSKVSTKKCILQLVALAAVFVSTKLFEPRAIGLKELQGLAEGIYLESDICLMELELLRVLAWELNPVTPYCFLRYLILYFDHIDAQIRERVLSFAETFLEIVLCEYAFIGFLPSEQATASLLCALDMCHLDESDLGQQLWSASLVKSGRVHVCKEILLEFVRDIFPEFFRSKTVVSPDCVTDGPGSSSASGPAALGCTRPSRSPSWDDRHYLLCGQAQDVQQEPRAQSY